MHLIAFNGHKRKNAIKFQTINTPDWLNIYFYGHIGGHRHDLPMYTRNVLDEYLLQILDKNVVRCILFGDSGYKIRWFMEEPLQGINLSPQHISFKTSMSATRITIECKYK